MLLKVNSTTNRLIVIVAIIQILLYIADVTMFIGNIKSSKIYFNITSVLLEILFLITGYYLISVLAFFKEQRFITAAFVIYIALDLVRNSPSLHIGIPEFSSGITGILYFLNFFSKIYILIATLNIKSAYLRFPFILYGCVLFIAGLANFAATFLYSFVLSGDYRSGNIKTLGTIISYTNMLWLITLVAVVILIRNINRFIAEQKEHVAVS